MPGIRQEVGGGFDVVHLQELLILSQLEGVFHHCAAGVPEDIAQAGISFVNHMHPRTLSQDFWSVFAPQGVGLPLQTFHLPSNTQLQPCLWHAGFCEFGLATSEHGVGVPPQ